MALYMYVNYYSEAKMKEFVSEMSESNLHDVFMDDLIYIVVENENNERLFIFGVLGKGRIFENNPMDVVQNCTLQGTGWVSVLSCSKDTEIYIETPENIYMMLNIIKEKENNGLKTIKAAIKKYCLLNCIHDYRQDYIVN